MSLCVCNAFGCPKCDPDNADQVGGYVPDSDPTAKAREIAAGLDPADAFVVGTFDNSSSPMPLEEGGRYNAASLRSLARLGVLERDESNARLYWTTDLGREVARVLAEGTVGR